MATRYRSLAAPAACFLAFALLFLSFFMLVFPSDAHAARTYGTLSSKYESGNDPSEIDYDSNGYGEAYGAYQMSTGNAYGFATWLKSGAGLSSSKTNYAVLTKWGTNLVSGYTKDKSKCGDNFDKAWYAAAKENSSLFFTYHYNYCIKVYYNPAVTIWKAKASGFNPKNYTKALRSVLFSVAVQHGPTGSGYVWGHVLDTIGGWQTGMAEDILINAIYDERSKLVTGTKELAYFPGCYTNKSPGYGIYLRLNTNERADALAMMKANGGVCSHSKTKGGTVTYTVVSETKHKVKTSAVSCKSCGAILKAASTKTVSHSFKCSGKSCKCACGQALVVHSKGKYYAVKTALNLRSSASTSSSVKATIPKGKILKATKAKKDSSGNWWLKVKYSGKTGYVRASYMSIHGTASSGHVHSNGKCKYCGASKSVLKKNTVAGTYKAASATTAYAAAYSSSSKKGTVASGTKLKIVKVVKNRYNDLWGKTSDGTYVDLRYFKRV